MNSIGRGSLVKLTLAFACLLSLGRAGVAAAQVCDPPGPPPRFGCQWSTSSCEWFCPTCDPFGSPPRPSCTWDLATCNWRCDGYTGVDVTVHTLQPPTQPATVYVRLSSLCTATGVLASCLGEFSVHPGMTVTQKCLALAAAVSGHCEAAGYAVTVNECDLSDRFTASNVDCPATSFALGISNSSAAFDQVWQGPLPDGEVEDTSGRTATCSPMPAPVDHVRLSKSGGVVHLSWDDAAGADDYLIFEDGAPDGAINTVIGTATSGMVGFNDPSTAPREFYLVAGENSACGVGPKR